MLPAHKARRRIPKSFRILGHVIRVRQVTPSELKKIVEEDVALDGLWIDSEKTIYVDKNLSIFTKRQVLWHELQHAIVDLREEG